MFPTNEYKHRSDLLWYQYQSEALDYDSYMIALTRLVQEEKGRYEWYQYHKAKEAAWEYERQREERLNQASRIEAEQEAAAAVKKAEAERLAKLSPQERY